MATVYELGVQIGNSLSFPKKNPHEYNYDTKDRHVAKIVGPASFPHSKEVYLAPPEHNRQFTIYNPKTDKARPAIEETGYDKDGHYHPGGPSPLQEGERLVQSINTRYTLFERA